MVILQRPPGAVYAARIRRPGPSCQFHLVEEYRYRHRGHVGGYGRYQRRGERNAGRAQPARDEPHCAAATAGSQLHLRLAPPQEPEGAVFVLLVGSIVTPAFRLVATL